ncbi:MAG: hypothetical protein ACI4U3_05460 [Traorella sp.]
MSLKSTAIKLATKKIKKSKTGKKVIKTATISSLLVGTSFLTYMLAFEGKKLKENSENSQDKI